MGGRDPCHRKEAGEAWSASILEVRNHRARGAWRTWSPPPTLTVQSVERRPGDGQRLVQDPPVHSSPLHSWSAGRCPSMYPRALPPQRPGSGRPLPGPVGAAPGCGDVVVTIELWELPQCLLIPRATFPPWDGGVPGSEPMWVRVQGEQALLGRGDGAASPALADGLSLYLDSVELPRTILEHGGVDSVLEETPPLPGPSPQPGDPGDLLRNHPTCPFRPQLRCKS